MITILTIIHVVVCFFLIVIVLLQHGKGADAGATFGGASQTIFGTEGPLPLLNKVTTASAIIFMMTSLSLAYLTANWGKDSVMRAVAPPPAPVEGTIQQTPATIPMPEPAGNASQSDAAVSKEFPGEKAAQEQKAEKSAVAPDKNGQPSGEEKK